MWIDFLYIFFMILNEASEQFIGTETTWTFLTIKVDAIPTLSSLCENQLKAVMLSSDTSRHYSIHIRYSYIQSIHSIYVFTQDSWIWMQSLIWLQTWYFKNQDSLFHLLKSPFKDYKHPTMMNSSLLNQPSSLFQNH